MGESNKDLYLKHALDIVDRILLDAQSDDYGMYWETAQWYDYGAKVKWEKRESLYNGVAGILLLIVETYNSTKLNKYLEASIKTSEWLKSHCDRFPASHWALYSGRIGVAFSFTRMFEVTRDIRYLDWAGQLCDKCEDSLTNTHITYDLLNGISGLVLVCIRVHAHTKSEKLLELLNRLVEAILKSLCPGRSGIYWDRPSGSIDGLCGFSHGASGPAFVLLELGRYFNNKDFYFLASEAIKYERTQFDQSRNNWKDLRISINLKDQSINLSPYLSPNSEIFNTSMDSVFWCHGAPGIGLTRLRAFELLNNELHRKELNTAISKTIMSSRHRDGKISHGICHGNSGNATLLLESYLTLGSIDYLNAAKELMDTILNDFSRYGRYITGESETNSPDLFLGLSGIAYVLLKLHSLESCSAIYPKITNPPSNKSSTIYYYLTIDRAKIFDLSLMRYFPITTSLLKQYYDEYYQRILLKHSDLDSFQIFTILESTLAQIANFNNSHINSHLLQESYRFELIKYSMWYSGCSWAFCEAHELQARRVFDTIRTEHLNNFLNRNLLINPTLQEYSSVYNWDKIEFARDNQDANTKYKYLVFRSGGTVKSLIVSSFLSVVIEQFKQESSTLNVVNALIRDKRFTNIDEGDLTLMLINQIKECIYGNLLYIYGE